MHAADTTTSLDGLVIEDDGEVLIDTADPSTDTVCETAVDIATALTTLDGGSGSVEADVLDRLVDWPGEVPEHAVVGDDEWLVARVA